jgi:dihydrolipoamide dehydrogenase
MDSETILVVTGRRPFADGLGAEKLGIKFDNKKRIDVNKNFQTNFPNIYAIGDLIHGPMLAHKAEEEAIAVIESLVGKNTHVNYDTIPNVVYSHPEIAWVGKTEEELKESNIAYNKGVFPFLANSRAKANDDTGFFKN